MNNGIVIYPGTFDPLTRGHEDLVRRAAKLFKHVIVGIAGSPSKKPFFTLEERVELAREVLADLVNVEIHGFQCLLMDFMRQQDRKSTRLNSSHSDRSRMPSSA